MNSKDIKYGILVQNALLKETYKGDQRTVLLGQVVLIDGELGKGNIGVRFLTEGNTWEPSRFSCPQENVVPISEKLWPYIASITSPQERVKLAKNKSLCDILKNISKDMVVGFMDTNDVYLGTVRYMGSVKGMGYCFGIELHDKKNNNICSGSCANIQYFSCTPGHGVFTSIERVRPINYPSTSNDPVPPKPSELDIYLERNINSIMNNSIDTKPHHEEIVTKYGEYTRKPSMPVKNSRNFQSLQNILDVESMTVNTNNDFDQNTVIQPDGIYLMPDMERKSKNKSEVDLIDVIGTWSGTTDSAQLQQYSNLKKGLDKNDNIKEKYVHGENNTLNRRNKSINPLSHLLEGNNSLRKSKFYTNDLTENYKEHLKTLPKKQENGRKINEKSEQLARSSTFYVNDKPKYHDPQPGTTHDLVVGSLVEVLNDVSTDPLYGVVRWMGVDNETNFILVGVELEEEQSHLPLTLTDGTHNGERFFNCATSRALFVPIEQCHKDSRFVDGTPTPVHQAAAAEQIECPVIPGAVAPLCMPTEEDVEAVCGKYRGIQGHHNSCYLDVTLFSMFTYTAVFDSLLFRPKNSNDIDDYEEVQRVLREEIVNPLRKNLFVSADHVMRLRRLLDRLSSVSGLTSEEKDPEEFLNSLLAQILKAEPFLKLNSGQEAFHYQLFVEKDADLTLPTVQQLFEQSFLTSNIKLKEVPSCLIIQMPRFGKNYKMYPRILPSQLLDVTDIIEGSPRQCIVCGKLAKCECRECFDDCSNAGLESTAFCLECLKTAHRHERRKHHRPTKLEVAQDFSLMQDAYRPPRLFMELFAVICIETSHYVAFVKCGVGHEAPWCFFDSMADRKGEKNGYNIPEMVACPDISRWLSDDRICRQLHEEFPLDRHLPEHAHKIEMYVEDKVSHRGPFPIEVTADQTVADLKTQIEKEFEIPADYQKWILGKELVTNENSTLKEYNVTTEGCPVFLYLVAPDPKSKTEKPKSPKIEEKKNPPSTSQIAVPSLSESVKEDKPPKPTADEEIEKMKMNVQNLQKKLKESKSEGKKIEIQQQKLCSPSTKLTSDKPNDSKNEVKKIEIQSQKLGSPITKPISQIPVLPAKAVSQPTNIVLQATPSKSVAKTIVQSASSSSPAKQLKTPVTIQQPPVVIDHTPKIINVIPKLAESRPKTEIIIPITVEEKSTKTEAKPKRVEKPISVTEIKIEEKQIQPTPKFQIRDSKGGDFAFPKARSPPKSGNNVTKQDASKVEKTEPKNSDAPVQGPQRKAENKEAPKAKEEDMEDYDSKTLKPAKEWECHLCTLLNPVSSNICAVCATVRLAKAQPPKRSPKKKAPQPNGGEASASKDQTYLQLVNLDNADLVENVEPFECVVCFLEIPPREGITLRECLHQFCKACLAHTIEYNEEAEVKCPYRDDDYSCNIALQDREIKALVSPVVYEQHLAKSVAQAENKMDKSFHCKTPDCKGWCVFEDNVNEFRCPVCRKTNCLTCQAIHMGVNCKQYQERMKEESEIDEDARRTRTMLNEMVERGEAIECPTCKVILMKKWGCDWLRCSMCKTEICWVTRGPRWGPAGKGDTSGGCQCGVNGVKCHPKCNYCH